MRLALLFIVMWTNRKLRKYLFNERPHKNDDLRGLLFSFNAAHLADYRGPRERGALGVGDELRGELTLPREGLLYDGDDTRGELWFW